MQKLLSILKDNWGYDQFRPGQEEIISSVLAGKDTLALLPTGGGKSMCYQVPALAQDGICIVVSPLIALMKDQVEQLKKRGIGALLIYSGMPRKDIVRTLENARQDYFKFLYLSPERLETSLFREYLPALSVNLIAVDEAHCISQWGYDFRPSYLRIADLRAELPDTPILAVTASATTDVQNDICEKLLFKTPIIFRQPFTRPNLSYSVFRVESKYNKLVDILSKVKGTAIVYCKSRKRTAEIASLLQMHGLSASSYHAGLPTDERSQRQNSWINDEVRVMVCTNAFGMGIDKSNVRLVVHMDVPESLEHYYQEAGRCGRDGKKAYAVLLYDEGDITELAELHIIRYPTFEQIREVYSKLVNFLQVPVNTGEDQSYAFHIESFIRNFELKSRECLYALKALEQDGWFSISEKNYTPSTVVFTTNKDHLYSFYQAHPPYELLCTSLLRTYDGIFDFPGFISEGFLSGMLHDTEADIKKQLTDLSGFGVIRYVPHDDAPFIFFRKNRVKPEDLTMNLKAMEKRKSIFVRRVNHMIQYLSSFQCRSQHIAQYFGEQAAPICGICDNCLRQKQTHIATKEFEEISVKVVQQITPKPLTMEELVTCLPGIKREKLWKVVEFLVAEKRVHRLKTGELTLAR